MNLPENTGKNLERGSEGNREQETWSPNLEPGRSDPVRESENQSGLFKRGCSGFVHQNRSLVLMLHLGPIGGRNSLAGFTSGIQVQLHLQSSVVHSDRCVDLSRAGESLRSRGKWVGLCVLWVLWWEER